MGIKSKIVVGEALRDLRSGMGDSALMQKYALSPTGLQSLLRQLVERGCITQAEIEQLMTAPETSVPASAATHHAAGPRMNPAEFVQDIRSGMHDFDLMEKYQLSIQKLDTLLEDLGRSGLLEPSEVDRRRPRADPTAVAQGTTAGPADAGECDESAVIKLTWECPVCGIYQSRSYAKCPECGALVALLTRKRPS
jgi:hypothetical protein